MESILNHDKIMAHPVIQQCINVETDYVLVSTHNSTCETCQKYEGKVFSISGKDTRFPQLDDVPPFCEKCRHTIHATFEWALKMNDLLPKYIAFSNGRSEIHPIDTGLIPVSVRPKIDLDEELKIRKKIVALNKKIESRELKIFGYTELSTQQLKIQIEIDGFVAERHSYASELMSKGSWLKFRPNLINNYHDEYSLSIEKY